MNKAENLRHIDFSVPDPFAFDSVPLFPVTPSSSISSDQFLDLNNRISHAYANMYNSDPGVFRWSGLAAYTSNRAGQGIASAGVLDDVFAGLGIAPNAMAPHEMYQAFIQLNFAIFLDLYPQFEAYAGGGLNAIQAMANEQVITQQQLQA